MTFPHSWIRTQCVKKSLDEEYEISLSTCEINYASYKPLLIERCMCYQYQRASLSANEYNMFYKNKNISYQGTLSSYNPTFQEHIFLIQRVWENHQQTNKEPSSQILSWQCKKAQSQTSFSIVLQETSTSEVFFVLLWHLLRFSTDARQLPSLNTPPKTPHTCTSVTTSVSWPSLTFLFHWPPYNETGHN